MSGVGPASSEYRAVCAHTGPTINGPVCGRPVAIHVLTVDSFHGAVALASCEMHADVARRAGRYEDEHPHQGVCGLPGTVWADGCCEIDDSGTEPVLMGIAGLAAAR